MSDPEIRIASYNVHKARGVDRRYMPERIIDVINGLDADVVVLQEADKRMGVRQPAIARSLFEADTDFDLVEVSENGISLGWHGNAVLVRPGIKVANVSRIDLPGLEPRGAVRVDLESEDRLSVVATHLGLRRKDRQAQLRALSDATQDQPRTIIAGDFNEWSEQRGLEELSARFSIHSPGRSFHARRPIAALDRFALGDGLNLYDAGVDQSKLARRASDHLPIWSDVALEPSPHQAGNIRSGF